MLVASATDEAKCIAFRTNFHNSIPPEVVEGDAGANTETLIPSQKISAKPGERKSLKASLTMPTFFITGAVCDERQLFLCFY
jgi:hypothetical protein